MLINILTQRTNSNRRESILRCISNIYIWLYIISI